MVNTLGLSHDQEAELEKHAAYLRQQNRNGRLRESACDRIAGGAIPSGLTEPEGPATANTNIGYLTQSLTLENIDDAMRYQPWDPDQAAAGDVVREGLTAAAKAILRAVPAGPYRSTALRKVLEARMDANAGISFRGRF